jgi:hypothetical protein
MHMKWMCMSAKCLMHVKAEHPAHWHCNLNVDAQCMKNMIDI